VRYCPAFAPICRPQPLRHRIINGDGSAFVEAATPLLGRSTAESRHNECRHAANGLQAPTCRGQQRTMLHTFQQALFHVFADEVISIDTNAQRLVQYCKYRRRKVYLACTFLKNPRQRERDGDNTPSPSLPQDKLPSPPHLIVPIGPDGFACHGNQTRMYIDGDSKHAVLSNVVARMACMNEMRP
jgi:hypothetical protein